MNVCPICTDRFETAEKLELHHRRVHLRINEPDLPVAPRIVPPHERVQEARKRAVDRLVELMMRGANALESVRLDHKQLRREFRTDIPINHAITYGPNHVNLKWQSAGDYGRTPEVTIFGWHDLTARQLQQLETFVLWGAEIIVRECEALRGKLEVEADAEIEGFETIGDPVK